MRIISWNCNMAFLRKSGAILGLVPNLCVIQEISQRDALKIDAPFCHWVGKSPHKGMAVFGFDDILYELMEPCPHELPWAIPLAAGNFHILAVWACVSCSTLRYVRVLHQIIDRYSEFLAAKPSIVIGDFNSNAIWDGKHPATSHSGIVAKLEAVGLQSLYHHQTREPQGSESQGTFFMYRKPDRPFHLDHAFVPIPLLDQSHLAIGSPDVWLAHSDHLPLVVDIPEIAPPPWKDRPFGGGPPSLQV